MTRNDKPLAPIQQRGVRSQDVVDLIVTAGYPCISVLLPTTPARSMTPENVAHLHELIARVESTLREQAVVGADRLMLRLNELASELITQPTDRAVTLYVNMAISRAFHLPVSVKPQSVVEGTFATRALVTALHRMPPHVLLIINESCAHLYQSHGGRLRQVGYRDAVSRRDDNGFLRGVDVMLGQYRTSHPSPLVLGGNALLVKRFQSRSGNLHRLAGELTPEKDWSRVDLGRAAAAVVEDYLHSRRREALERLDQALDDRPDIVACGMSQCWAALRQRTPGMLLVEEDFVSPGRLNADGLPETDIEASDDPRQVHDLVDDLIEAVLIRGGHLALLSAGDLGDLGGVVLLPQTQAR